MRPINSKFFCWYMKGFDQYVIYRVNMYSVISSTIYIGTDFNTRHGILKNTQCMQHFEFGLRVRSWSNKSSLIFQFILFYRFLREHFKHQIFNILQYFKYILDYFWLSVCILNGNERINWRKYIYSQYNPYKKLSLYRKTSAVFIFW